MKRTAINTFEEIHHVCLMYGLKKAFCRLPFLTSNILATPPPVRKNPERPSLLPGFRRTPVTVQYFKKDIYILYDENKVVPEDALAFAKAVMEEYLAFRHPYMKTCWKDLILSECSSDHAIAEIIPDFSTTADRP